MSETGLLSTNGTKTSTSTRTNFNSNSNVNDSPTKTSPSLSQHQPQKRIRASGEVLNFLITEFNKNPNPSPDRRKVISDRAAMSEKAVRIWFQNRRAKQRKHERSRKLDTNAYHIQPHHSSSSTFDLIQRPTSSTSTSTSPPQSFSNNSPSNTPIEINEKYSFIDCTSLSVGSWQRIKSGKHNFDLMKNNLFKLSPFNLNTIMTQVDLMVILSKKNQELNYFFSAMTNKDSRILFRIFYPLSAISSCSLHENSIEDKSTGLITNSNELRVNLCHQPKFSVYFFNGVNSSTNQWSICDDFSEGQQVSQAYTLNPKTYPNYDQDDINLSHSPSGIPHVIVGGRSALTYLSSYINANNSDYNSLQATAVPLIRPPPPPQPAAQPSTAVPTSYIQQHNQHNHPIQYKHNSLDMSTGLSTTALEFDLNSLWQNHNLTADPTTLASTANFNINQSPYSTTSSSQQYYQSEDTPQSMQSFNAQSQLQGQLGSNSNSNSSGSGGSGSGNIIKYSSMTNVSNLNSAVGSNIIKTASTSPEDILSFHEQVVANTHNLGKPAYTHTSEFVDFNDGTGSGLEFTTDFDFAIGLGEGDREHDRERENDLEGDFHEEVPASSQTQPLDLHQTMTVDFIDFNA